VLHASYRLQFGQIFKNIQTKPKGKIFAAKPPLKTAEFSKFGSIKAKFPTLIKCMERLNGYQEYCQPGNGKLGQLPTGQLPTRQLSTTKMTTRGTANRTTANSLQYN